MNLKKLILVIITTYLLISCNKISDLDSISKNEKLNSVLDEFIENIKNQKVVETEDAIYITGIKKNDSIYEISVNNYRPTIYTDKNSQFLNKNILNSKLGYFQYKNFDFFVSKDLNEFFSLNYKNAIKYDSKFDKQEYPSPSEYYSMWINLNIKNNKISYVMPFVGMDWKKK